MSGLFALQTAIYSILDSGLSDPVYSAGNVPEELESLFVVIGETTALPHDSDTDVGFEATITIHSWDSDSNSRGYGKLKPLMDQIYSILNRADLIVTGYTVLDVMFEFGQPFLDPDGITTHGVQRFRIIMTAD